MTIQQEIITKLLDKFPKAGMLTIARMAYENNKSVFSSLAAARSNVRNLCGRKADGIKHPITHPRPAAKPGDPFGKIPDGLTHFESWQSVQIDGALKCLILSDLHIPYHDRSAIITALAHGKKVGVDTVLLNGDTADFFSVSFWEKDPRKRRFADELKTVREFITTLRETFPKARIIFKEGNHEERWQRYMFVKAPELLGVAEFEPKAMLGLDGIELVNEKRPIRLGKLNVLHGHEYRFMISNPVNPARGLFLRCKAFALCGHFHQSSYHSAKTVEQKNVACWSTGCLCDLHPDYAVFNEWSLGFAVVETQNSGDFEVKNHYISAEGRVY